MSNGEGDRKDRGWTKTDRNTALISVLVVVALLTLPFAAVSLDNRSSSQNPIGASNDAVVDPENTDDAQFGTGSEDERYVTGGGVTGAQYIYGPDEYGPLGKFRLAYSVTNTASRTVELLGWDSAAGYNQTSGPVDIPRSMTSSGITYTVTSIGSNAFNGASHITYVTVPDSVTEIKASAFTSCIGLMSIFVWSSNANYSSENGVLFDKNKTTLITYPAGKTDNYVVPSSVRTIANNGFYNAQRLMSVKMSNGLTSIGTNAFLTCIALSSVDIPDTVTSLGASPFYNCTSLSSINIGSGNANYSSEDGVLFNKAKTSLITYPAGKGGEYTVPSSVSVIESNAFRYSKVTFVNVSNTTTIRDNAFLNCANLESFDLGRTTSIGANAFHTCSNLVSVTIPSTVTSIGGSSFYNCINLKSINVESANVNYSSEGGVLFNKAKTTLIAYPADKGGSYTVPTSVTRIDGNAFFASKVVTVNTNNVTWIGNNAFQSSLSLSSADMPNVTEMGLNAFRACGLLQTVNMGVVKIIGNDAFNACSAMKSVIIPASVTSIGSNAFVNCANLQSITVASDNPNYSSEDGVLFNKNKTTLISYPCGKAGDYVVPSSTVTISAYAFYSAYKITSVNTSNATTIGTYAFYNCQSLSSVTMGSVISIGSNAFHNSTSLSHIVIPNSTTTIGASIFFGCSNLQSITVGSGNSNYTSDDGVLFNKTKTLLISYPAGKSGDYVVPASVLTIDLNAFNGSKVSSVVMSNVKSIGQTAFQNSPNLSSVDLGSVVSIGTNAFNGCVNLSSVTIPDCVMSIGNTAFTNCLNLQSINVGASNAYYSSEDGVLFDRDKERLICYPGGKGGNYTVPSSVMTIEGYAFYGSKISSVDINEAVFIGSYAFYNCVNMVSVKFGNAIFIGNSAFHGCQSLQLTVIPEGVRYIGINAFNACVYILSVNIPSTVVYIGGTAFHNCGQLASITVAPGNLNYSSEGGVLFDKNKTALILYPAGKGGDYVVPSSVKIIETYGFYASKIRSVSMTDVTSIGLDSFRGCYYLQSIDVASSNLNYSSDDGILLDKSKNRLICYPAGRGGGYTVPSSVRSIDQYAFLNSKVSSVDLSNVVCINSNAFNASSNLTSVTIPDSVISLGAATFTNCANLQSINVGSGNSNYSSEDGVLFNNDKTSLICYPGGKAGDYVVPSSVLMIEPNGFQNASRLTSVDLNNVIYVGNNGFYSCNNMMSVNLRDVVYMGTYSFYGCSNLLTIEIPDSLTFIGIYSFYNPIRLESINVGSNNPNYSSEDGVLFNKTKTLLIYYPIGKGGQYVVPSSVLTIEIYAFYNATKVTSVDLNNVRSIGTNAFVYCTSLASINISADLTGIGHRAFFGCSSMVSIDVDPGNPAFSSEDGVLFNKAKTLLIQYPAGKGGDYVIPSSVTSIGYEGFRNSKITSVDLNNVVDIGINAFLSCQSLVYADLKNVVNIGVSGFNNTMLERVTIPSSTQSIGLMAFTNSTNLTSITVEPGNPNYSSEDGVLFDKTKTQLICYPAGKGGEYTVPSTVSDLIPYAFYISKVTSVDLSNVKVIDNYGFFNCTELLSITIPESVTYIGIQALYLCTSLTSITVESANKNYSSEDGVLFDKQKTLLIQYPLAKGGDYVVPGSVSMIEMHAFRNSKVTSVDFSNVEYIGNHAFFNSVYLASINLRNVVGINNNAFDYCISLTSVNVPDSTTHIGQYAFVNSRNLESINVGAGNPNYSSEDGVLFDKSKAALICYPGGKSGDYVVPSSVSTIEINAFYNAQNLTSIDLNNVTFIGTNAFINCYNLRSVQMDNLRFIAYGAFNTCPSLESVSISDNVTAIGNRAFLNCTNLQSITVDPNNPNYLSEDGVLFDKAKTKIIQYPGGKGGDYVVPESVSIIAMNAFYGAHRLTSVSMSAVTTIEAEAFFNCTGLTSVRLSDNLAAIGASAFRNCISLSSITIPDNVAYIGDYAFNDSAALQSIIVASNNEKFSSDDGVLFNKSKTKLICYPAGKSGDYVVPSPVLEIGGSAFDHSGVTSITMENVTSIGANAFYRCRDLVSVTIPDSVVSIGLEVFRECDKLESISVGSNNVNYLSDDGVLFDKAKTTLIKYPGERTATVYSIPSTVTKLNSYAFQYTSNLATLNMPANLEFICSANVFQSSTSLVSINVDGSNPHMMSEDGILFNKTKTMLMVYPSKRAGTSYDVPSSVISIKASAFFESSNLVSVNVHDNASIGPWAFHGGESLIDINVGENNAGHKSVDGVLFDKSGATLETYPSGRTGIYTVPEDVNLIQTHAFRNSNLTSLVIPCNILTSVGYLAFYNSPELSIYFDGDTLPRFSLKAFDEDLKGYYSHGIKDTSWWETPNFRPGSEKIGAFNYLTLTPAPDEEVFTGLEKTPVAFKVNTVDAPISREWIESNIPEIGGMDMEFSTDGGNTWLPLEMHVLSQDTVGIARAFPPNDITVEAGDHGTAVADKDAVVDGENVTITITPDSKYKVSGLTVNNMIVPLTELDEDGDSWKYVIENVTEDIHVVVNFGIDDTLFYDVTVLATTNGTVIASNIRPNGGSNVVVTITPKDGYKVKTFKDNGRLIPVSEVTYNEVGKYWTYTISEIIDNHIIATEFEIDRTKTYTVEVLAGPNGRISTTAPNVKGGSPVMITITPDPGYKITSFKDNSVEILDELSSAVDGVWTYSISEVTSNHSFEARFGINTDLTYTVTATSGGNGSVSVDPETANGGSDVIVTITPSQGYRIKSIRDNSNPVVPTVTSGAWTYTIRSIIANHTIHVEFEVDPMLKHRITVTYGSNGTASITDPDVSGGSDALVKIYPNSGYQVATITDNGNSIAVSALERIDDTWVYRIPNVTAAHLVHVTFEINPDAIHRITMNKEGSGSISADETAPQGGTDVVVTMTPSPGYKLLNVSDNGVLVSESLLYEEDGVWTYTITSITMDHTIVVTFVVDTSLDHKITMDVGDNGSANPDKATYKGGESPFIVIRPDPGYTISEVRDNGVLVEPVMSGAVWIYTINTITEDHTVAVSFMIDKTATHTITIRPGSNGTATVDVPSPKGGDRSTVTIVPDQGYKVASIKDNGVDVDVDGLTGPDGSKIYSIYPVTSSHTISITFEIDVTKEYTITVDSEGPGTVVASPPMVNGGGRVEVSMTPAPGYMISVVIDNGNEVDSHGFTHFEGTWKYVLDPVIENHEIHVLFIVNADAIYNINVSTVGNGTAVANDTRPHGGDDVAITITPQKGYKITELLDNGTPVDMGSLRPGSNSSVIYDIRNVIANHIISVTFGVDMSVNYTITVTKGPNGSASADDPAPHGGEEVTVTITPDPGYKIRSLTDNGTSIDVGSMEPTAGSYFYFMTDIFEDHLVTVEFIVNNELVHQVLVTEGDNGKAVADIPAPTGGQRVIVTVTPDPGYKVASMTDNGTNVIGLLKDVGNSKIYVLSSVTYSHNIDVTFSPDDSVPHNVTVTHGTEGTASADNPSPKGGENVIVSITPNRGYRIASVTDNGENVDMNQVIGVNGHWEYTISSIVANHNVNVTFEINDSTIYDITVTRGSNGSASADKQSPRGGEDVKIIITPDGGYRIASVTDNGVDVDIARIPSLEGVWTYTISSVISNHDVHVTFEIDTSARHTVTVTTGANGTATVENGSPMGGQTSVVKMTPTPGYKVASVTDNTTPVDLSVVVKYGNTWEYTISSITGDHEVHVEFEIDDLQTYTVTATAGPNGSVSPETASVPGGGTRIVSITPDTGYKLLSVTDNGKPVDPIPSGQSWLYTISSIIDNHEVHAEFTPDELESYLITTGTDGKGTATADIREPNGGDDVKITITANYGYKVAAVTDNGVEVDTPTKIGGVWIYLISSVVADHYVHVTFEIDTSKRYPVDVTPGPNGSAFADNVAPNGGDDVTITITPSSGYTLVSLKDNGVNIPIGGLDHENGTWTYTILSIVGGHEVEVEFDIDTTETYQIKTIDRPNGMASVDNTAPNGGGTVIITIMPDNGYRLDTLTDNGNPVDITKLPKNGNTRTYTISSVISDHLIDATFVVDEGESYDINFDPMVNGDASTDNPRPNGGSNVLIRITPEYGYTIDSVSDNGVPVDPVNVIREGSYWKYTITNVIEDHTISATFKINDGIRHTIIINDVENGSVSASDTAPMGGTVVTITITPAPGYKLASVKDNGKTVTDLSQTETGWEYKTAPVTNDHTIDVIFTVDSGKVYAILISPHQNGTVTASTTAPNGGDDVTVEVTPMKGYKITSIMDNDVPVDIGGLTEVGGSWMYVIEFVIANHKIDVVFDIDTGTKYNITTETDGNGTAVSNPPAASGGGTAAVTITPNDGYRILSVEDNGVQVSLDELIENGTVYVIMGILEDHLVRVAFEIDPTQKHDIITETDGNGNAEPNSSTVNGGDNIEILITPNSGFMVKSVLDNGNEVDISDLRPSGRSKIYTISEITKDHMIAVEFEIDRSIPYSVTLGQTEHGEVATDKTTAYGGENVRITITPEYGYMISSVKDNGSDVQFDTSQPGQPWVYTITAVTDNHNIVVTFAVNTNMTHYITTNYEGVGSVIASTLAPKGMSDVTIVITPTPGYKVTAVTDNGVSVMGDIIETTPGIWVYMINSVTSNHTIHAVFEIDTTLQHTVSAKAVGEGNVVVSKPSPMGGENSIITMTPASGYRIMKVTDNGVIVDSKDMISLPTGKLYAISKIYTDHEIIVTFEVDPGVGYEVNVVAGENGTAFPDKPFPDGGENVTVSITPSNGYRILTVVDNGITIPLTELELIDGVWYYVIVDIIGDHTVSILFEIDPTIPYDVDLLPTENGTVSKEPQQPYGGDDVVITLTPADGYILYSLKDNGIKVDMNKLIKSGNSWKYTISEIAADHEIEATFKVNSSAVYEIRLNTGPNGTVDSDMFSPHGGDTATITITPFQGYIITSFKDNGVEVEPSKIVKTNGSWVYLIECITSNHVIDTEFGIDTNVKYNITATTDGNGTASPDPTEVKGGQTSVVTMTPNYGYTMGYVTDNGDIVDETLVIYQNGIWKYTLSSVSENHEIEVTFIVDTTIEHTITVTAHDNGSASSDANKVFGGGNVIITITPNTGYGIATLTDNGEKAIATSVGTKWIYTISNVTEDHDIEVTFDVNSELKYDIIVTSEENGTASADKTRPKGGEDVTVTIKPNRGFLIASLTDNGIPVVPTQSGTEWVYIIRSVTDNHMIDVKFKADPNERYEIKVNTGSHGEAEADDPMPYGGNDVVIIITPDQGYRVATLTDNGKEIDLSTALRFGGSRFYMIESVTEDHEIEVTFEINPLAIYDISVSAGENGTAVSDKSVVNGGDNVTVTITPKNGYRIASLTDNGVDVTATQSGSSWKYTILQVIEEHSIEVTFEIDTNIPYDVTLNVGNNGTATKNIEVPRGGDDVTICIIPRNGYRIASVTDNGVPVSLTPLGDCWNYVIISILEDHVISVTFEIDPNQTHDVNVSFGDHGTASADKVSVKGGREVTITMTPDTGYRLLSLTVNGEIIPMSDIQESGKSMLYVVRNISETVNASVVFELITYKVILTGGKGYDILPVDSSSPVLPGESFTFSFALHDDYSRSEYHIYVNNAEVELVDGMYTIRNIQGDILVTVTGVTSNKVELENTTMVVFGSIGAIMLIAIAAGGLMSRKK